ncbi:MAG: sigma-70 family RNA polymerase sigma factor [Clostridia bacterium]
MDKSTKEAINTCIEGVRQRNEASLNELHSLIAPTLRYIALKYLKSTFEADDLVQDFWENIYKIVDGFVYGKNGFGFLCKTMNRIAINRYKKLYRDNSREVEFVDYEVIIPSNKTNDFECSDIKSAVELAMHDLTKMEKIIIQETYFEDKTIRNIAKDLNLSKSKVGRMKIEATNKMKAVLEKNGWGNEDKEV